MDNQPIDHKFKEFFEQRTLAPKDNAWDRMESLMPVSEVPSTAKKMPLYWVAAASFAGFMIALFLLNQRPAVKTHEVVAKADVHLGADSLDEAITQTIILPSVVKNDTNVIADILPRKRFSASQSESTLNFGHQVNEIVYSTEPISTIAVKIEDDVVVASKTDKHEIKSESIHNIKIDAHLLLKEVDQELKAKKKISSGVASLSFKPDPSKLLEEAEKANEKSTLQKIFKSLQNNSENVIAVVSNRNYQK